MSLRDEIQALVARDNELTPHHMSVHRVRRNELHPPLVDGESVSKSVSTYGARATVEDFHARLESRSRRPVDTDNIPTSDGESHIDDPVVHTARVDGVTVRIQSVTLKDDEMVEVWCKGIEADRLPIYFVNPPLIALAEDGDIEFELDGETFTAKEDPVAVIEQEVSQLLRRG